MTRRLAIAFLAMAHQIVCVAAGDTAATVFIMAERTGSVEFGTGFFIDDRGMVVTAYHVLMGARKVTIWDAQNNPYTSENNKIQVINLDAKDDIALLSINTKTPNHFNLDSATPKSGIQLKIIGHPNGFKFQTLSAQTTQDGFASSISIPDTQGKPIYSQNFDVIPLNITVYNGMSGGPVIDQNGDVIGLLSGSLNVGGSLAWSIPAKAIEKMMHEPSTWPKDIRSISWTGLPTNSQWRSFGVPKDVSISDTVAWINAKWTNDGARNADKQGLPIHVTESRASYNEATKTVSFATRYSYLGEYYRALTTISLPDAASAVSDERYLTDKSGYFVLVKCPVDRSCVSTKLLKETVTETKVLVDDKTNNTRIWPWFFADADASGRVASAINHLIRLHDGPAQKSDLF